MPLWRIFSHPKTFTPAQRSALAKDLTAYYTRIGLPAFYVNVIFIDVDENGLYIGGQPKDNFVRIVVEHIARELPSDEAEEGRKYRKAMMDRINDVLKPHIADRPELQWEHHLYYTPRDLWRVQGLDPPLRDTEAEKAWARDNKPTPFETSSHI